jgi:hypothetical protein
MLQVFIFFLLFSQLLWAQENGLECPKSYDGEDLEEFRDKIIKSKIPVVKDILKTCFPKEIPKCFEEVLYEDNVKNNVHLSRTDFKDTGIVSSPSDLPKIFFNPSQPNKVIIPKDIEKLDKNDPNLQTLFYKTRSTGGFEGGNNLFIMTYSTPKRDYVLQTSPHIDNTDDSEPKKVSPEGRNILTVIVMDKTSDPPVAEMRLLGSSQTNSGVYNWDPPASSQACSECHTGPFRAISPKGYGETNGEKKLSKEDEEKIQSINSILEQFTSWGTQKVNGHDIKLGNDFRNQLVGWAPPDSPTRTTDWLKNCATKNKNLGYYGFGYYNKNFEMNKNPQINYANLSSAMNCYSCHNNSFHGGIDNQIFSSNEIKFKILVDRSMPRGENLNQDERIALVNCLEEERYNSGVRDKWFEEKPFLKKISCFGKQFNGQTPSVIGSLKETKKSKKGNKSEASSQ